MHRNPTPLHVSEPCNIQLRDVQWYRGWMLRSLNFRSHEALFQEFIGFRVKGFKGLGFGVSGTHVLGESVAYSLTS